MTSRFIAAVGVLFVCAALAHAAQSPGARLLSRPADGFSVSVPAGWVEKTESGGTPMIVQNSQPDVLVMFFVQREATPTAVTDVLAKASVKLKNDASRKVISSQFDVVLDRPALVAVSEDATARYKLTLLPREEGDRSQIYYGVVAAAPRAMFAKVEAALDRIVAGFTIVALATATAAPAQSPPRATTQGAPTANGSATAASNRAKVTERILSPRPRSQD